MRRPIQQYCALIALELSAAAVAQERSPTVLGAGAYTIPVYPGSSKVEVRPVPVMDIVVWDRLFLKSGEGAGAFLWHNSSWDVGVSVDADLLHRYEVDDDRLAGLGNVGKTARANLFVTRRCEWMETTVKLSTDIGGAGHGNAVDIELAKSHILTPRLSVRTGIGTTWTNTHYMRTFFGVDAQQSTRSGLPIFTPDGGFSSGRLFLSARYEVRSHWLIGGQVYAGRLFGDAADSPITQRRTTAGGGVFLAYLVR
jgi:outer membrane protein